MFELNKPHKSKNKLAALYNGEAEVTFNVYDLASGSTKPVSKSYKLEDLDSYDIPPKSIILKGEAAQEFYRKMDQNANQDPYELAKEILNNKSTGYLNTQAFTYESPEHFQRILTSIMLPEIKEDLTKSIIDKTNKLSLLSNDPVEEYILKRKIDLDSKYFGIINGIPSNDIEKISYSYVKNISSQYKDERIYLKTERYNLRAEQSKQNRDMAPSNSKNLAKPNEMEIQMM